MDKLTKENVFQLFQQLTGLNDKIKLMNEEFPRNPLIEEAIALNERVLAYQEQVEKSNGENIPAELDHLAQESFFAMSKAINRGHKELKGTKRLTKSEMLKLFPLLPKINGTMEKMIQDGSPLAPFAVEAIKLNKQALTFQKKVKESTEEIIPDELQSIVARSIELMGIINLAE
jgi:hypothetical protein